MSFNLNKICLLGTLGKDLGISFTTSNLEIGKVSLATSHSQKKGDDWEQLTTWHNLTLFKPSDFIKGKLKKGAKIYLEGRQQHDSYEKDGVKKYFSSVIVDNFSIIPFDKSEATTEHSYNDNPSGSQEEKDDLPF